MLAELQNKGMEWRHWRGRTQAIAQHRAMALIFGYQGLFHAGDLCHPLTRCAVYSSSIAS